MNKGGAEHSMTEVTLPKLLKQKAETMGEAVALREKEFGIWQEFTWSDYYQNVKAFSYGLLHLGFKRGDRLALIGDNRPEWLFGALAAQSLGGISVGIYQDSLPKELVYFLNHSEVNIVIAEDQEQVDKLLEIKAEIPEVEYIIYYDPKGLVYQNERLLSVQDVQSLGEQYRQRADALVYEEEVAKGRSDDIAIFCYTSGTTANPKAAMLSHHNLINMGESLMQLDPMEPGDEFLSFLPLAWIGEQMMSLSSALHIGFTVNFPEETTTVQENLREIGPHAMFSPPRIWEDMVSKVQVRIQDAGWLKRKLYDLAIRTGYKRADALINKKPVGLGLNLSYLFWDWLVFSAIRDHLGLLRLKRAYTGGAALGPDVTRFFHAIGVNLKQIYGQTEVAGIAIVHQDGDIKYETVGVPIPGTEIKISEKGEILIKSPSVFKGYYKNEQSTRETVTDGWLHTGDAGELDDDGHLIVIDRLKDVIRLENGDMYSPQFIENKLKFSPYIKEAMAVGTDRSFVAAILNIDMENVGQWAENNQIAYTTYTDLSQKPEVLELICTEVKRINQDLPQTARVERFVLLYKELDADDEELTRTRKIRRQFVTDKYRDVIEGLYSEQAAIDVKGTIRYQDGKEVTIETQLRIVQTSQRDEEVA
ncbi:long-chain acyl-CoA synthetase [Caldalkalibacillus uzonensis]|uniref:Acyl-CoA synthetase n=2 Tax=Caldalkalibacillus uzonensis TaxID=353224 RepID=A0ABU0CU22_9BACI|nr:long-chain acyl-CoA synthetase [Caldalkalibacillus uzonensis]